MHKRSCSRLAPALRHACAALVFGLPAPALAAAHPAAHPAAWTVRDAPHVALWFHGLAVVGYDGGGVVPLYDPGYAARARRAKQAAHRFPTRLDRRAPALLAALRRDPAFEVLHFLPLYFAETDRESMFAALRGVARGHVAAGDADPSTRRAAAALAAALPRADQRRVLAEFVDALDAEWHDFYAADEAARARRRRGADSLLAAVWAGRLAPAVAHYLDARRMGTGTIIASHVLGTEGRIIRDAAGRKGHVLVAVRAPASTSAHDVNAAAFLVLRELCFPVVREVLAARPRPRSRADAERTSAAIAARCGSLALARHAPALRGEYDAALAADAPPAPGSGRGGSATLRSAFPLDSATEALLARAVAVP